MRIKGFLNPSDSTDVHTSGPFEVIRNNQDHVVGDVYEGSYQGSVDIQIGDSPYSTSYFAIQTDTRSFLIQACASLRYNAHSLKINDHVKFIFEGKRGTEEQQFYSFAVLKARPQPALTWEIASTRQEIRGPFKIKSSS